MTDYFHGGVIGLRVGDYVLPPAETGAASIADVATAPAEMLDEVSRVYRRNAVYLSTDPDVAFLFAAYFVGGDRKRGGNVYRVEPDGDVERDPDYLPADGGSVCARRARVVGIVATGVNRARWGAVVAS